MNPASKLSRAAAIAVCVISGSLLSVPASAQQELIFGISAPTGSLQARTSEYFTRLANEKLAGRATVKLFPDAQLGKDKELMQKLKLGTVHIALPSSVMSSVADEFGVFDMPFLVKDRAHVAAIEKEIFWSEIAPAAEPRGYRVIGMWENGIRHITNNRHPIDTPADLAGLKLRTPKSKWRVIMFKTLGANPTPMAFSEVFVGLQTGVIDGQENPLTNIYAAKLNEVQKYLSLTGHVYSPSYPTMGKATFDKLDPGVRAALLEAAAEATTWARKQGAADDDELLGKLKAAGMQVNTADRASFVAASKAVYEQYATEFPKGSELIERALALGK